MCEDCLVTDVVRTIIAITTTPSEPPRRQRLVKESSNESVDRKSNWNNLCDMAKCMVQAMHETITASSMSWEVSRLMMRWRGSSRAAIPASCICWKTLRSKNRHHLQRKMRRHFSEGSCRFHLHAWTRRSWRRTKRRRRSCSSMVVLHVKSTKLVWSARVFYMAWLEGGRRTETSDRPPCFERLATSPAHLHFLRSSAGGTHSGVVHR